MSDLLGTAAELVEQGVSMQEPEFYDAAMTGRGEPAMLPYEQSPWLPIYREAARWIPNTVTVTDLGCGTGRFAALLFSTSFHGRYRGLDFSPAAIKEAESYVVDYRVSFKVVDLRQWEPLRRMDGEWFVCLEVLEHLEDDLGMIERLPPGSPFIFSVPTYMSASHVRCFETLRSVFERFGNALDIRRWSLIDFGNGNYVHVCDSTRRGGTW